MTSEEATLAGAGIGAGANILSNVLGNFWNAGEVDKANKRSELVNSISYQAAQARAAGINPLAALGMRGVSVEAPNMTAPLTGIDANSVMSAMMTGKTMELNEKKKTLMEEELKQSMSNTKILEAEEYGATAEKNTLMWLNGIMEQAKKEEAEGKPSATNLIKMMAKIAPAVATILNRPKRSVNITGQK